VSLEASELVAIRAASWQGCSEYCCSGTGVLSTAVLSTAVLSTAMLAGVRPVSQGGIRVRPD